MQERLEESPKQKEEVEQEEARRTSWEKCEKEQEERFKRGNWRSDREIKVSTREKDKKDEEKTSKEGRGNR